MPVTKMGIAQYNDFRKAQADGDDDKAGRIMDMGYQKEYDPSLVLAEEAVLFEEEEEVKDENEAILDDLAAGLSNKEIYDRYGISPKKLSMIKAEAK